MATSLKTTITTQTKHLLELLGLSQVGVEVKNEDEAFSVNLSVNPEESGVLIGYHGETIASLQLIISLIVHKQLGEWHRLIVNINDYRQKHEQNLIEMAKATAARVKATGQEAMLPPLESFDRRLVHMALSDDQTVRTESMGEGPDRRLIIYPASPPPTSS